MSTVVPTTTTVRETRHGKVRGTLTDTVAAFKGIPYAAPPFGANRFLPPQPVKRWSGVREAFTFGPRPPQVQLPPGMELFIPDIVGAGEDCLNLNVWSPEGSSAGHPVMVWLTGGAFEAASAAAFDGSRFARDGVVCVTLNYRVGADGFLFLGDGNSNRGLLDQIAALEWVQDNIAAFGGDPINVTVFGQSAGAHSIGALLAIQRAHGLFRRAIVLSGGAQYVISAAAAQRVAHNFAQLLDVEVSQEALATVTTELLLSAQLALRAELAGDPDPERWGPEVVVNMMPWMPVVDGDVIPARPLDRIVAGASADIDLLVGSNRDEWHAFLVPGDAIDHIPEEMLIGVLASYGLPVDAALATYRSTRPGAGAGELLSAIQGDWYLRIPALKLAEAHAKSRAATYMYEFGWRSPQFGGRLGACHGLEVPFVFDALDDGMEPLLGADPPQHLADRMHSAWVAFAATGDCGWPKYELDRRSTMRFDVISQVVDDPRPAERALWQCVS